MAATRSYEQHFVADGQRVGGALERTLKALGGWTTSFVDREGGRIDASLSPGSVPWSDRAILRILPATDGQGGVLVAIELSAPVALSRSGPRDAAVQALFERVEATLAGS